MAVNLIFKSNVPGARVVRLMSLRSGRLVDRFFASAAFCPAYQGAVKGEIAIQLGTELAKIKLTSTERHLYRFK